MSDGSRSTIQRRSRFLLVFTRTAPWWVSLVVGIAAVVLGAILIVRPLSSLSTLALYLGASFIISGIADLLGAARTAARPLGWIIGVGWIIAGIVVLVWVGTAIDALPVFLAVVLVVTGVIRAIGVLRGTADERATSLILGLADIVFGVLALEWPDATLLIVAVLFGGRTVLFGLTRVWAAITTVATRRRMDAGGQPRRPGRFRRWIRVLGAVVALLLAVAAAGLGAQLQPGDALADPFYSAPTSVPDTPGTLLRSEPFHTGLPKGTQAWRILYTTTRDDRTPAIASGVVYAAVDRPSGPLPVIAWAHGTTGYATACAPSLLDDPLGSGAGTSLADAMDKGWILVSTDYAGLGTSGPEPYLIGQGEGRSVLDSVRAAKQLTRLDVADQTVIWGHSQGGHAALWAGQLATGYAPDLNVVGVAALAPASDTVGLTDNLPNVPGGSVFASFVAAAYTQTYSNVKFDDYITPSARTLVREMSSRCLAKPDTFVSILSALSLSKDRSIFARNPTSGPLGERLRQNIPTGRIEAPLFIGQGLADPLVLPSVQKNYVKGRCAAGQGLDYRTYAGRDHLSLVAADSPLIPDLVAWTTARLAGDPAPTDCDALP